jgi:fluoride exporter
MQHPLWREMLAVVAGGALGSLLRFLVGHYAHYQTSSPFPYKTLLVNLIGCFLAGYVAMRLPQGGALQVYRVFFLTGFLGAFTTFSAFSLETVNLYQDGHVRTAVWNVVLSSVSGIAAVLAGLWTGRA